MLRYQVREADASLMIDLPAGGTVVSADAGQIKQVLLNLIVNALHALRERETREVSVRIERKQSMAHITISDTGCGMPQSVLARAFDPFFTTKGPTEGTGLGLSVCEGIIRAHGGRLHIDSDEGVGTKAAIDLPLSSETPAAEIPPDVIIPNGKNEMLRVLVADDEEFVVNLVQEVLRTYIRCRVESVSDGAEALKRIESNHYDLVISDVRMPNMDGLDLYAHVADRWPKLASRFIFITGDAGGRASNKRLASTGVPVLLKPFNIDLLVNECRRILVPETALG
jgi:CheY-like chemotaxis protein/anti-sigma regulatory factor (Ser/Thr protein kinase)